MLFIDIAKWEFPFLEELICLIDVTKFAQYLVIESHHQSLTLVLSLFSQDNILNLKVFTSLLSFSNVIVSLSLQNLSKS